MRTDATSLAPAFTVVSGQAVATVAINGFVKATGYGGAIVQMTCKGQVATTQLVVLPEGTFLLYGQVNYGPQHTPVVDAKVDFVTPGQSFTTTTDGVGRYSLPAVGSGTLHVEAANYTSQSLPVTLVGDTQLDVALDRSNDVFAGTYTLTFTASPSCSLPADVSTRRYIAKVEDSVTNPVVRLSGATFFLWGPEEPGFTGTRSGNAVRFVIGDEYSTFTFVEDLGNDRQLSFSGQATGTIESGELRTLFSGSVWLFAPFSVYTGCTATDHRLDFTR